jgi:hypothetical protein
MNQIELIPHGILLGKRETMLIFIRQKYPLFDTYKQTRINFRWFFQQLVNDITDNV